MPRLGKALALIVAAAAISVLVGCQSNKAGKAGYVPTNCAMPGSSCDLERW